MHTFFFRQWSKSKRTQALKFQSLILAIERLKNLPLEETSKDRRGGTPRPARS
jgi:hypothetical protein